ncbi:MAG: protein phosphatase 2C domain-containing protein [Eubacteriales bacterium]|nr:protein phosphatase 2C domain-containing protein [Eubacteriales bacterium]
MNNPICYSHIGKRLNYEDNFLINGIYLTSDMQKQMLDNQCYFVTGDAPSKVCLFAVSDGMGGHNAGEVASLICVQKLAEAEKKLQQYHSIKEMVAYLQSVIAEINTIVCNLSNSHEDLQGMGATLVLFVTTGIDYAILNVGDSRAYYFINDRLNQITKDNTEGQRMIDLGLLTRKELLNFPARKNLNRYIGYDQNGYILQADVYYPSLENGTLLLCSDGITDFLPDSKIFKILCSENDLERAGKQLITEAIVANNADNATAMLIPLRR